MEDKINTKDKIKVKLLTLIGALVLFVLVIGSTFAYFQVGATGNSSTTITATTPSIPSVAITGGSTPHITLGVSDMSEATAGEAGKSFYSTTTSANYAAEPEKHLLSTLTLTGGKANQNYGCWVWYRINLTGGPFNKGDAILYLEGADLIAFPGSGTTENGIFHTDLSDFITNGEDYEGLALFTLTSNGTKVTKDLYGYIEVVNKTTNQNHLAGQTIKFDLLAHGIDCNEG